MDILSKAFCFLAGGGPLCYVRKGSEVPPQPAQEPDSSYVMDTGRGFKIEWTPCRSPRRSGVCFKSGSYHCIENTSNLCNSSTLTRSCAALLSLETGDVHTWRDVNIPRAERDVKSTHRVNHETVRTNQKLTPEAREALLRKYLP